MKFFRSNGNRVPRVIEQMAVETRRGKMDRREFLPHLALPLRGGGDDAG